AKRASKIEAVLDSHMLPKADSRVSRLSTTNVKNLTDKKLEAETMDQMNGMDKSAQKSTVSKAVDPDLDMDAIFNETITGYKYVNEVDQLNINGKHHSKQSFCVAANVTSAVAMLAEFGQLLLRKAVPIDMHQFHGMVHDKVKLAFKLLLGKMRNPSPTAPIKVVVIGGSWVPCDKELQACLEMEVQEATGLCLVFEYCLVGEWPE
ncbi:hypothetical protein GGF32_007423, partial [Allomyces javanicus]